MNIDMKHIINDNIFKSQSAINNELFGLFGSDSEFNLSSKKSYNKEEK
jgi:hypothetical protein